MLKIFEKRKYGILLVLHFLLLLYSGSVILVKLAAQSKFLSLRFCLCYAGMFLLLAIYALGWQQVIRHIPLTTAFSNKAVTVIWGILWGRLIFGEPVTPGKVIGALIVISGIVLYAFSDGG